MELSEVKTLALVRIVDDDAQLADALKFFLEVEGWKTQVHTSAREFFASDRPSVPGCVILDVRMPELTGLECQKLLREHQIALPVIFMSGHGDIDMAVQAVLDGARDFLQKPVDENRLLRGVEAATLESVTRSRGIVDATEAKSRIAGLTQRELEIVRLVAQNLVSRQIAERLGIATRTVEVHRASALKKLGVRQSEQVAALFAALSE